MVKFGHFCYNRSLDKQATEFYRNTCQQLTEWCFSDTEKTQARIEEVDKELCNLIQIVDMHDTCSKLNVVHSVMWVTIIFYEENI